MRKAFQNLQMELKEIENFYKFLQTNIFLKKRKKVFFKIINVLHFQLITLSFWELIWQKQHKKIK